MAKQSPNLPGRGLPNTRQIDLRGQAAYGASIDWLRNNLVLKDNPKGTVLQLDVLLPNGTVALFMDPWNQYILAFRGADAIYVLRDDARVKFKQALASAVRGEAIEDVDIGAGHGPEGLETFRGGGKWPRGREFSLTDLRVAQILSTYSKPRKNVDHGELQKALSLLVHMIAESARIPTLESSFTHRLYLGSPVSADLAVRSYKDAQELIHCSRKLFPNELRYVAVERLQKRAAEMDLLLTRLEKTTKAKDRLTLIQNILGGPVAGQPIAVLAARFREMCDELRLTRNDAPFIKEMITACKSDDAIFAAKQGVAMPDLPRKV